MPPAAPSTAATLLSHDAHGLRNHVATLRSIVRLIDDDEIADALDEASRALQLAIERGVVAARVDLDRRPELVALATDELVALAARRARREGAALDDTMLADDPAPVLVPGPWAERLLADLLHHADSGARMTTDAAGERDVQLELTLVRAVEPPLDAAMTSLAGACGGSLELAEGAAVLRLPRAVSEG